MNAPTNKMAAIKVMVHAAGPDGIGYADVMTICSARSTAEKATLLLRKDGVIFGGRFFREGGSCGRFYAKKEWLDAALMVDKAYAKEREREKWRRNSNKTNAKRAAGILSKPARQKKPKKLPKPKPHQVLTIAKKKESKTDKWVGAQAYTTAATKITIAPTPLDRWHIEPGFVGQITQDWQERRKLWG